MSDNNEATDKNDEIDFSDVSEDLLDAKVKAWHENDKAGLVKSNKKILAEKRNVDEKLSNRTAELAEANSKLSEYEELLGGGNLQEIMSFYNERKDLTPDASEQDFLNRGRKAMENELRPQIEKLEHKNKQLVEENQSLRTQNVQFQTISPIKSAVMGIEAKNRRTAEILLKEDWSFDPAYNRLVGKKPDDGEMIIDSEGNPKAIQDYVEDGSIYKDYPVLNMKQTQGLGLSGSDASKFGFDANPFDPKSFNVTKQQMLKNENPELYLKLKSQAS